MAQEIEQREGVEATPRASGAGRRVAGLAAVWTGLVLVMLQPTPGSLTTTLPNDLGDPSFVLATMRWGAESLVRRPLEVFDPPFYWPTENALGFSETSLTYAPFHGVVTWITGNPVAGFNLVGIGLFVLSLVATYLLARWLLDRGDTAVLVAAVFTFTSYSLGQQSHIQLMSFGLIPLAVVGLLRFLDEGRRRDCALVVVASVALVYASVYYSLLWALVGPGIVVVLVALGHRPTARTLWRGAAGVVVVALLALPGLALHADVSATHGIHRSIDEVDALLWGDLLTPAAGNWLWGSTFDSINSIDRAGDHGFMVGLLAYALGAVGLAAVVSDARRPRAGDRDDDVRADGGAVDRRHALWAVVLAGLGSLVVALGPDVLGPVSPYRLLYRVVPGFDGVRSSSRLVVVALLALALLVGIAAGRIADLVGRRAGSTTAGRAVVTVLLVVAMSEVLVLGQARVDAWRPDDVVSAYAAVESSPPGAVLELPLQVPPGFEWPFVEAPRMALYITDQDHPRVNGYSGHWPNGWFERAVALRDWPNADAERIVDELDVRYVVVHGTSPWDEAPVDPVEVERILAGRPAGSSLEQHGRVWVIDLHPEGD